MVEELADLRPNNLELYKENAKFLNRAKDKEKFADEYRERLHPRIFNHVFSRNSLVALKDERAVIDSEKIKQALYALRDNAKSERSMEDTPFYKPLEKIKRRAFRDGYNWVRDKDRPHKVVQKMFKIPEKVKKTEFTPEEVEKVLEGKESIEEVESFQRRERNGIISNQDLLYDASPDQLAGAMFTSMVAQRSILFHRSISTTAIMSGVALGGYSCYTAADAKSFYDEGIKKGVGDELHELGTWMKMEALEGKKVKVEGGKIPDTNQVKFDQEPYFKY